MWDIKFLMVFFFNDTATTEIYTLSLHDALPILDAQEALRIGLVNQVVPKDRLLETAFQFVERVARIPPETVKISLRSEEHTSELQSRQYLACRLLLENIKCLLFVIYRCCHF